MDHSALHHRHFCAGVTMVLVRSGKLKDAARIAALLEADNQLGRGGPHPRMDFVFNISVASSLFMAYSFDKQPLVYVIFGECSSARLRGQNIGIARNVYILGALPVAFIASCSMNPPAWGWGTYAGLFWVSGLETVTALSRIDKAVWNVLDLPYLGVLQSNRLTQSKYAFIAFKDPEEFLKAWKEMDGELIRPSSDSRCPSPAPCAGKCKGHR
jgi:hypothetical protein